MPRSLAETFTTPSVSISKRHLDLRHAARRGRDADQLEAAEALVVGRHLALALEHVDAHDVLVVLGGREHLALRVGIVVFFSMIFVKTPPCVSTPSESGVTSSSSTSSTSPFSTPPWIAAPIATTSSGFTPFCGFLPKISATFSWTRGMRVMPPTRITSSISLASRPASVERGLAGLDEALDQVGHQRLEPFARERER